jgi:rare lipoprotein A
LKATHFIPVVLILFTGYNTLAQVSSTQTGFASFYHDSFNGKRTASGQILNQKKFTCAHRTYPFGTRLKITNLENCKTAVVTVNDRGPFTRGRIIDVTAAVARELGFWAQGQARVQIEIVSSEGLTDSVYITEDSTQPFYKIEAIDKGMNGYTVKVASFYVQSKALEVVRDLKKRCDCEIFMQTVDKPDGLLYRIFAGDFKTKAHAESERDKIAAEFPDCYVVELTKK